MTTIDFTVQRAVGGPDVTIYITPEGDHGTSIADAHSLARILMMALPSTTWEMFVGFVNDIDED